MGDIGVPSAIQQRIIRFHDESTVDQISTNPYLLVNFGMPFKDVDEIACTKFSVQIDDSRRLEAAVAISLQKEIVKGHTYADRKVIRPHLERLLESKELAELALSISQSKYVFFEGQRCNTLHPTALFIMENVIVKRFTALANVMNLFTPLVDLEFKKAMDTVLFRWNGKDNCFKCSVSSLQGYAVHYSSDGYFWKGGYAVERVDWYAYTNNCGLSSKRPH